MRLVWIDLGLVLLVLLLVVVMMAMKRFVHQDIALQTLQFRPRIVEVLRLVKPLVRLEAREAVMVVPQQCAC